MPDYKTPRQRLKKVSESFKRSLGTDKPESEEKEDKDLGERFSESIKARREGRVEKKRSEPKSESSIVRRVIRFLKGRRPE